MKNILIIDDNKDLLDALSAALRCHLKECTIMTALDGAKGVNIVESAPIDLIVADLAMPVMNGYTNRSPSIGLTRGEGRVWFSFMSGASGSLLKHRTSARSWPRGCRCSKRGPVRSAGMV
jgi:hypothetical protein